MKTVALITGASSGIGKELAYIHAAKGGDLVLVARRETQLIELQHDLKETYSVNVEYIVKDLSLTGAATELYNEVVEKGIIVDLLINNAGYGGLGKFHERDWQQDLGMIQLNVIALAELTRHFLPSMVDRKQGRILNVSSTASLIPGPLQAVYFASKAFVTSFSNALAGELHDSPVTVTALLPGATETEFGQRAKMENTELFSNLVTAKSVAEDGYRAMMRGDLNVISGLNFANRILIQLSPLLPKAMLLNRVRKMQTEKS
jgi:short-subunit dehydrogenase